MTGYCLPICLWEKDGNSKPEEQQFFEAVKNVDDICYHHLENEFGPELSNDFKSPLYFKKTEYTDSKGKKKLKIDENSAPVLYAKLIYCEKSNKILSLFKTKGNTSVDPFDCLNQYWIVKVASIFEGLYLSKILFLFK